MDVMKQLGQLAGELEAAQAEKAALRERIDGVDQGVAQLLGELQKAGATHGHVRCAPQNPLTMSGVGEDARAFRQRCASLLTC
jgi:hypothetical protein